MKITDQNNLTQREALLNECKGNLFEFLVAQGLSKKYQKEDKFLLTLSRDFKNRLRIYEETIRSSDEKLLLGLPALAQSVVTEILKLPVFSKNNNSFEFMVIGKMVATNDNSTWNETDIVALEELHNNEIQKHFLSLKLTKDHSYTNTKSAGVKSFLLKYFSEFTEASLFQNILSKEVDESFHSMGHQLYSLVDLEFTGAFDQRWELTELPGELNPEMRAVVHSNYHRVALKLHGLLEQLKNKNENLFRESLEALCGFGNKNIIQVHCFHQQAQLKDIVIKTYADLFAENENIKLGKLRKDGSSFDVHFSQFHLQLRVKPMNKFTTAAYKINCSIKMDGKEDDV